MTLAFLASYSPKRYSNLSFTLAGMLVRQESLCGILISTSHGLSGGDRNHSAYYQGEESLETASSFL